MKISTVISSALFLSAALSGCMTEEPPTPVDTNLYTDMPRVSTVNGYVIDPEAFFALSAQWPVDPEDPEGPPPPMLFNGMPYFELSSVSGANVYLASGTHQTERSATNERGVWQVFNVPTTETDAYLMHTEPLASGVHLGAGVPFPSPVELPESHYVATTTLRPIVPSVPLCQYQVATLVSDTGALAALANARTSAGTPTTVDDLLNPGKTGGVVLAWVYAPSFLADWFQFPADSIAAEPSMGQLYSLDWAPPGVGGPDQSPMGYIASEGGVSPLGYYAVVLPPGASGELTVQFADTTPEGGEPGPFGPRPYFIPPLSAPIQPGVSMARVFSFPGGDEEEPPPTSTDDEEMPPSPSEDFGVFCFPR
ncbi:hypothetical protein [Archangium sp.]|uniref:hypothetical protein n=1 Tax=Archangium sp. TaxID=1872627 RepID=UPI003899C5DE